MQISEEQIDYRELVQHVDGPATAKSKHLHGYEKQKLYPPRLSLRVIRTLHEVQQDLVTVVTVKGVTDVSVHGVKPSIGFSIFARAPPGKYTNWMNINKPIIFIGNKILIDIIYFCSGHIVLVDLGLVVAKTVLEQGPG